MVNQYLKSIRWVFDTVSLLVLGVFALSLVSLWNAGQARKEIERINSFYFPVLRRLSLINGKWESYKKSLDNHLRFEDWGKEELHLGRPSLYLRSTLEAELNELNHLLEKSQEDTELNSGRHQILGLIEGFQGLIRSEPVRLAGITVFIEDKKISEAGRIYSELKKSHHNQTALFHNTVKFFESQVALRHGQSLQEMGQSQGILMALMVCALLVALFLSSKLKAWILSLVSWRENISMLTKNILSGETRDFQRNLKNLPENGDREFDLVATEIRRMAITVLEHEKTIQNQKQNLESLNEHLKAQNLTLKKLGSLNEKVLQSMESGLLVVDSAGVCEQFNDSFCKLFHLDKERIYKKNIQDFLKEFSSQTIAKWLTSTDSGKIQKNQSGRIWNVFIQHLKNNEDEKTGTVLIFEDTTKSVEAERRLAHAEKLTVAGNLSSQVAHEIRNPLNSILLNLEILEDEKEQGFEMTERVRRIRDQIERLERITEKYLKVEPSLSGEKEEFKHKKEKLSVNDLIEKTLEFSSLEIQSKKVAVELDLDSSLPEISADEDQLTQVFLNLIHNSLEALQSKSEGERKIKIVSRIIKLSTSEKKIMVSVDDTGPGVSLAIQEKIFQPFVTDKPNGHGLGLSLSRKICLDHGGELSLCHPNRFEVSLPCSC